MVRLRDRKEHLKDLVPSAETWPELFSLFLATIKFQNGFEIMKVLSIPSRIKWMKACAALWGRMGKNFSQIFFAADDLKQGEQLNAFLESIPIATIDGFWEERIRDEKWANPLNRTEPLKYGDSALISTGKNPF